MTTVTNPELEALHAEARSCTKCALAQTRKLVVPGDGPADAELMFIEIGRAHV